MENKRVEELLIPLAKVVFNLGLVVYDRLSQMVNLTARDLEDPDLVVGRLLKLFFLLVEKSEKASELEKENEELKRKLREVEEELESWRRMESILRPDYEAH
jgi:hypothetical protein